MDIITDQDALRQVSERVKKDEIKEVTKSLKESIPGTALGLAAPQIGVFKQAFIANLSSKQLVFINPKIDKVSFDRVPSMESCLSLPGIVKCVERYQEITVSSDNLETMRLKGLNSFIVQHEVDHLDGILLIDLTEVKSRETILAEKRQKKLQKIAKNRKSRRSFSTVQQSKPSQPLTKKEKKSRKKFMKKEKLRVEIQERYKVEKSGLFDES